ncbi:hypothetical protein MASR2M29_10860 [Spirochaetota bacterium]
MTLDSIRNDIDRIDSRILALLDERFGKALLARRYKIETFDHNREKEVLERVGKRAKGIMTETFITKLYTDIMGESRTIQDRMPKLLGFQGMHGAYSEAAAKAWKPGAACLPFMEFSQVFDALVNGVLDYGIVPVENTLGGIVGQVNSILVSTELHIIAAIDMPVSHCLLALPGTNHREIRSAWSHPQALAQCRRFLLRNKIDAIEYCDTAAAARMLSEDQPKGSAAVASRYAAELYGLEIIKEGIQDSGNNRTRFFVLAKNPNGNGNKCSIVFFTDDKAGSLFNVLEVFAKSGINLTRIESVPDEPGDYAMFIDFDGSENEPHVAKALETVGNNTRNFRFLGCYEERKL